jgi:FdhE protein
MKVASINWQDKIDRAQLLSSQQDATGDVLRFYAKVLSFQEEVDSRLNASTTEARQTAPFVPEFLDLLAHSGTADMKELASSAHGLDWNTELESYWAERDRREYSPLSFIALALLQPFAHHLAQNTETKGNLIAPHCPFCGCAPQLGVLRPEGEGGKRYLLCSLCVTEWEYRRVICPNCEESDKEKLPIFNSDQIPAVRLAACETCRTYLKCIDLCVDGNAIPEIDDVASLPLSIWMTEHGFRPIRTNLFGF